MGEIDVKRYDRQIRLWGLETQRGLLGARVLLLRATGLCNEIAKNLVLAGVGHVCIQDPCAVTESDLEAGGVFSITQTDVGRNRASAMADGLRVLNPQVEISSTDSEMSTLDCSFIQTFHFVVGTHGSGAVVELMKCTERFCDGERAGDDPALQERSMKRLRTELDEAVNLKNGLHVELPARHPAYMPRMLAAGALGLFGFCVLDLHDNKYILKSNKATAAAGNTSRDVAPIEHRIIYPSIAQAFQVNWGALDSRVPRLYCALQLLVEQASKVTTEEGAIEHLRASKLAEANLSEGFLREAVDAEFVAKVAEHNGMEVPAVCAIMGGMVASEVVKIISGQEAPINNVFLFDATTDSGGAGVVVRMGPSFKCLW
eukprot:CAMPEP_0119314624 /NCGR_PEP_ID=MMETSP1333-20130426/33409_1 /TAXON_ID=418940 /ORGANISM="Scyphosphaera apsteinii, Strain RCC1455" /LENGTH=372 /DNA_ID=CAMNT_0007319773 /DNA_START=20 /DNA_END=1135 /DNA_ORIENTATION=+